MSNSSPAIWMWRLRLRKSNTPAGRAGGAEPVAAPAGAPKRAPAGELCDYEAVGSVKSIRYISSPLPPRTETSELVRQGLFSKETDFSFCGCGREGTQRAFSLPARPQPL